jgi:hypothetical protein
MKNHYFGDVNDYRKYGLIRALTGQGTLNSMICWMLTEDDDRADGGKLDYLLKQDTWRGYDEELFDTLREAVVFKGERSVRVAKEKDIIPGADYYEALLTDDKIERSEYFAQFLLEAHGKDLYFFDPDNGMEVASVPFGRKHSSKYLYWQELKGIHEKGASVLIYQHFPHVKRDAFIARRAVEFQKRTTFEEIISFRTPHVVFFLLALEKHMEVFTSAIHHLVNRWGISGNVW